MNKYKKYCANVYVAECNEEHAKGEIITLETKYGKENEHEIHNFLSQTREGNFLYSITRVDGFNHQERARNKSERLRDYSTRAASKSFDFYDKSSMSEERTGIALGQPILVGHHSEKAHRAALARSHNAMSKSIEENTKAENYEQRAKYWDKKQKDINLSMPESIEFFRSKLEDAKQEHEELKKFPEKRLHSYSLTYAKKEVNNMKKNLDLAIKLWGETA